MSNLLLSSGLVFDAVTIISLGFIFVLYSIAFVAVLLLIGRSIGKYAERNGHNLKTWTVLGFFFGLTALLSLHIAIVAERNGHNFALWAWFGFFFGIYSLMSLQTGLVAERKGFDFVRFCLLGGFLGVITLLIACFLPEHKVNITTNIETKEK